MAIALVQSAGTAISNQTDKTMTWSTAPTEGNLIIAAIAYDASATLVLPPDETDGWTTRVAEAALGSDSTRVVRIDTAIVGPGTDTSWLWDINPNGILGIIAVELSGADIGGSLKTDSQIDSSTPISIDIDGTDDPAGEMFYLIFLATKNFGGSISYSNDDPSMTIIHEVESGGGTNFAMAGWHEILDAARPTATLTSDQNNTTGTGVLLGVPVAAAGTTFTETMTGTIALSDLVGDYGPTKVAHTPAGLLALADLTGAYGPSKIAATYEGDTTPAGALTKFSPRAFAGAITVLTGDLIRKTAKPLAGVIATITGALAQRTAKLLEGTITTTAGDLIRKTSKLLEGTLTSSGFSNHIIPLFKIAISGAITSAGALVLKTAKLLEGTASSSAELRRETAALFEGTIALSDLTGALTTIKKILITLTGAISTLTGETIRKILHTPSGDLTPAGTLIKATTQLLDGTLTLSGFSNHIIPLFKIAIGGALTLAGALIRQTQTTKTASTTPAGQYGPSVVRKLLEGTSTQIGDLSLAKTIVVALSGALTLVGGLIRKTAATITATAGSSGTLTRSTAATMSGDIPPSGDLRRKTSILLGAALTLAGALATVLIPPALAGPISRIIRHQGRAGAVVRHQGSTGRQI